MSALADLLAAERILWTYALEMIIPFFSARSTTSLAGIERGRFRTNAALSPWRMTGLFLVDRFFAAIGCLVVSSLRLNDTAKDASVYNTNFCKCFDSHGSHKVFLHK